MNSSQIQAYLKRISFKNNLDASVGTLSLLQSKHLLSVPFENLDIHFRKRIKLDISNFYKKVVILNRGGFCYELNGLFNQLLSAIGFKTKMVSARAFGPNKKYGAEFDHLAIIVQINDSSYLTDVGFGEFSFSPLKLDPSQVHDDVRGRFRVSKLDENEWLVCKQENGNWLPEYRFSLKERKLSDFNDMCSFHQTSPDSHFTRKRLCSLPTRAGRKTISGNGFIVKENGKTRETEIRNEVEFRKILLSHFQMKL